MADHEPSSIDSGTKNWEIPTTFPNAEKNHDLKILFREGERMEQIINNELSKKNQPLVARGSHTWLLGYLSFLIKPGRGLQKGDLNGLKILDIGGGGYNPSETIFGPDLSRSLAFFGADVTLVDPKSKKVDFTDEELERVTVRASTLQSYLADPQKQPANILVTSAFFGSEEGLRKDRSYIVGLLSRMATLAPVQIHAIQTGDMLPGDFVSTPEIEKMGLVVKNNLNTTSQHPMGMNPNLTVNFLVIDNRK